MIDVKIYFSLICAISFQTFIFTAAHQTQLTKTNVENLLSVRPADYQHIYSYLESSSKNIYPNTKIFYECTCNKPKCDLSGYKKTYYDANVGYGSKGDRVVIDSIE